MRRSQSFSSITSVLKSKVSFMTIETFSLGADQYSCGSAGTQAGRPLQNPNKPHNIVPSLPVPNVRLAKKLKKTKKKHDF